MKPVLQPGDFFSTKNPMALGKLIRLAEALPWRDGHKSVYSHSGIITDDTGNTVEELWRLSANNLDAYKGEQLIIGRWNGMTTEKFEESMMTVCADLYAPYPFWRLALMLIPRAARVISDGKHAVCSERTGQCLIECGWKDSKGIITDWRNIDPQGISDLLDGSRPEFTKVFEGVWEG